MRVRVTICVAGSPTKTHQPSRYAVGSCPSISVACRIYISLFDGARTATRYGHRWLILFFLFRILFVAGLEAGALKEKEVWETRVCTLSFFLVRFLKTGFLSAFIRAASDL